MSGDGARRGVKRAIDAGCILLVAPAAAMCVIEAGVSDRAEAAFTFWAQSFALVPGVVGVFLRRAFYRCTLDACGRSFFIGFGAFCSHRSVTIEDDVYVGPYAIVGSARLRRGCLIGSRCSILSGGALHTLDENLRWTATERGSIRSIEIGRYAWLGEAAVVLADIGDSAMVAAGAVVSSPVPPETMVGGNPARFVRRLRIRPTDEEVPDAPAAVSVR
jgi:acetyltransferase-like isoleucine patch superfamily enzyme